VTARFVVYEATSAADVEAVRRLVLAHVEERAVMPGIEHMRADAMRLPGPYVAPRGAIFLARSGGEPVGCVALRPTPHDIGEVKRMYVNAAWRGRGVGRALLEALIARARAMDYCALRLGTIADMTAARSLYAALGFTPIGRYRPDEMVDTEFYELTLA
jgi:putative acetyltransferase